jgi:tRNA (guanine-N7-)-methyltransferase
MDGVNEDPPAARRILHGRRQGPKLRPGRRQLLDERLPALGFRVEPGTSLDPLALFTPAPRTVWLEIGLGGGEHLAAQAAANPEVGCIGVEPFINGVAKLLATVEAKQLGNVRVLVDDARLLLKALPDATIARAFVLFPDPWPKLRHHKRRLVSTGFAALAASRLAPGAVWRLATDWPDYAARMAEVLDAEPRLEGGVTDRWKERPVTRFERRGLAAGRPVTDLCYRRVDR